MRPALLSMRWWLALAFAGIAALTAIAVSQVFASRSESAIRARAQELAAGSTLAAAGRISGAETVEDLRSVTAEAGRARRLALFVFAVDRSSLTPARVRGVTVHELPNFAALLDAALGGTRSVETIDDGRLVTVALPLRAEPGAALIAVASRPDLETALGIVRNEIVTAALWAVLIAAVAGLVVAMLITRRLRRISRAAAEIEQGRFDRELRPRFGDELGALADTIDRMRIRLRDSFERLAGERDRLERLLEKLQEGVVAIDRRLVVEFANSQARLLVDPGLEPGRPLPDPWESISLREEVGALFAPDTPARSIRVEPDATRTYLVSFLPPSPAAEVAVVVVTDVTAQELQEKAEREFVTNAAHELRTPLAAIASAVEALQHGAKHEAEDRDRFLDVVERQTRRLTRLAHALLTLARAQTRSEPVRLEQIEIPPLLRELAESLTPASVQIEVCCEHVAVLGHRELLHQALENLTSNVLKHAPKSVLTLRAMHADDGLVQIDVSDTGPGMTRRDAGRALDRFYRATDSNGESFGLGLAIVYEVVQAIGGTVSISSAPERGTTVSLVLKGADLPTCRT